MKNRIIWLMVVVTVVAMITAGCTKRNTYDTNSVPEEIENLYRDFLLAGIEGNYSAFSEYQHYEIIEYKEWGEESFVPIEEYVIDSWERLSEELWVVTNHIKTSDEFEGREYHHFVGLIDGKYYVMVGTRQLPAGLAGDLDLSKYDNPNSVNVDDVIKTE